MREKDLDKVLNYMKQYVENIYEHDSEPMLNWKDLKLVLEEIERLNNIINRIENIYSSLCFSAPENNYIFIEELGEVLQELKGSDKE